MNYILQTNSDANRIRSTNMILGRLDHRRLTIVCEQMNTAMGRWPPHVYLAT